MYHWKSRRIKCLLAILSCCLFSMEGKAKEITLHHSQDIPGTVFCLIYRKPRTIHFKNNFKNSGGSPSIVICNLNKSFCPKVKIHHPQPCRNLPVEEWFINHSVTDDVTTKAVGVLKYLHQIRRVFISKNALIYFGFLAGTTWAQHELS